jgi:hypothetical protein
MVLHTKLFCFLRRSGAVTAATQPLLEEQPLTVEVAPRWSRFDDAVLMQVREKMETVFRLPLTRF